MGKRKRESERPPVQVSASTERATSFSSKRKGKSRATDKDTKGPDRILVVWKLADGTRRWKKRISELKSPFFQLDLVSTGMSKLITVIDMADRLPEPNKELDDILPRLVKHLGLPHSSLRNVRLAHLRDGHREVDIYDGKSLFRNHEKQNVE